MFSSWGRGDSPAQQGTNLDWLLSGGGGGPASPPDLYPCLHPRCPAASSPGCWVLRPWQLRLVSKEPHLRALKKKNVQNIGSAPPPQQE